MFTFQRFCRASIKYSSDIEFALLVCCKRVYYFLNLIKTNFFKLSPTTFADFPEISTENYGLKRFICVCLSFLFSFHPSILLSVFISVILSFCHAFFSFSDGPLKNLQLKFQQKFCEFRPNFSEKTGREIFRIFIRTSINSSLLV